MDAIERLERKAKKYGAEKRAGLIVLGIVSITLVTAVMISLDCTLKTFGASGSLGV